MTAKFSPLIILTLVATSTHSTIASQSEARILLRYTDQDKADILEEGVLESTQFDGNEVSVTAASPIDINLLVDDETAPKNRCFEGSVNDAKKILQAMVELTDGNGEHYLEKMQIEKSSASKITGHFTVKGNQGLKKHTISISACRPSPQE